MLHLRKHGGFYLSVTFASAMFAAYFLVEPVRWNCPCIASLNFETGQWTFKDADDRMPLRKG